MQKENRMKLVKRSKSCGGFIMKINTVPLWEKYNLTIQEASEYFGIGETKLRKIVDNNSDAVYILMNGTKVLIKRKLFEEFIDATSSI